MHERNDPYLQPEAFNARVAVHSGNLSLFVGTPELSDVVCDLVRNHASNCLARRRVSGGEHDNVGLELFTVFEQDAVLGQFLDFNAY